MEAAGITPLWPPRPDGTVAERVAAARRLEQDGQSVRAIADAIGVKPETARRYLKAHPCRSCGGPVVGAAKLCHVCATRQGNPRRWSPEELIAAVHRWVALEGRTPTAEDWRALRLGGAPRWEEEFGEWPPSSVGRLVFGSWSTMLETAGVRANKPSWKPEEILAALRAYAEEFGRSPAKGELEWPPTGYPSSRTVRRHFGSFTSGLQAAGLKPRGQRRWDAEEIVGAMREFHREVARWPRPSDWVKACEEWPSANTVYKRFGRWGAALEAARD